MQRLDEIISWAEIRNTRSLFHQKPYYYALLRERQHKVFFLACFASSVPWRGAFALRCWSFVKWTFSMLHPSLLKNIKYAFAVISEVTHSVNQSKLCVIQAHIPTLQRELCSHVARKALSGREHKYFYISKCCVFKTFLERFFMFALDTIARLPTKYYISS